MSSVMNAIKINTVLTGTKKTVSASSPAMRSSLKMRTSRRAPLMMSMLVGFLVTSSSFTSVRASASASQESAFVKKAISSHDVVIFSKSYCPYCKRAKAVFKELSQSAHVIELDEREDGHDIQAALGEMVGRRTVPQVFVNGKHIGGSDDTIEAYESGELTRMLGGAVPTSFYS